MRRHLPIYLRTFRKKYGLTQREAAFLVGMETGQIVSRHEGRARIPSLRTAIAYQIVFGASLKTLFPELYQEVEYLTLKRALALRATIPTTRPSRRKAYKRRCLEETIRRTDARLDI